MVAAPDKSQKKYEIVLELPTDFLKVLPYLFTGGQFHKAIHMAIELDIGISLLRARCLKLVELGIAEPGEEEDTHVLTTAGKDFCQLIYAPIATAKTVVSKVERNLLQLALAHSLAHPDKNKGRIEFLQTYLAKNYAETSKQEDTSATSAAVVEVNSDQHGTNPEEALPTFEKETIPSGAQPLEPLPRKDSGSQPKREMVSQQEEFWRLKNGLHPIAWQEGLDAIPCHELPVEEQIQLCQQYIENQKLRLEDLRQHKSSSVKKVEPEVNQIIKEESSRISYLTSLLSQPSWVQEAEQELNDIQRQFDNCSIEADKAKDGSEVKNALTQEYKINQQALQQCIERYSKLAQDCGYSLCLQEMSGEIYNELLVWVVPDDKSKHARDVSPAQAPEKRVSLEAGGNASRASQPDIPNQQAVREIKRVEIAPTTNENQGTDNLTRPGTDLVSDEELTPDEELERTRLEKKVDHGLYSAWSALREIRDRRLYRPETWKAYCESRFGYKRGNADWKIHAADAYEILENSLLISKQTLPSSEQQVRALRALPQEQWEEVWEEAIGQTAGKKPPSGRIVQSIVDRIKGKTKRELEFQVGDVVTISRPIKYSGCWGVVQAMDGREETIVVSTWKEDAFLVEDPDKITRVDSLVKRQGILDIWLRCKALRKCPDRRSEGVRG